MWDDYADQHLEHHEDRLKCRHCGNVIEDHPDDHVTGCAAVKDWPDPPEEQIPDEDGMIIPERDQNDTE